MDRIGKNLRELSVLGRMLINKNNELKARNEELEKENEKLRETILKMSQEKC
jgi:cell division protein FtsB